jgi:hypothetical protein
MRSDLLGRFNSWRARLPVRTARLVQRVLDELVPIYESAGLRRHEDYAGADFRSVGANCIPLQRRQGANWPTVEIQFDRRSRPTFNIVFAELPEVCRRRSANTATKIDRIDANVVEGEASFLLCKGTRRNFDCTFGLVGITLFPDSRIDNELSLAVARSQKLVELFNSGIPPEWLSAPPGYLSDSIFKHPFH